MYCSYPVFKKSQIFYPPGGVSFQRKHLQDAFLQLQFFPSTETPTSARHAGRFRRRVDLFVRRWTDTQSRISDRKTVLQVEQGQVENERGFLTFTFLFLNNE